MTDGVSPGIGKSALTAGLAGRAAAAGLDLELFGEDRIDLFSVRPDRTRFPRSDIPDYGDDGPVVVAGGGEAQVATPAIGVETGRIRPGGGAPQGREAPR
jgi:hypothetical protein